MSSERRLRVCFLIGRYPPDFGGWGIQNLRLLPHLAQEGVEVEVVTRRLTDDVDWRQTNSQPVHRILPAKRGGIAPLLGAWALRRHLSHHPYDVVHDSLSSLELILNLPWMSRQALPVVHEMVLLDGDDPLARSRQRLGRFKVRQLRRYVGAWLGIAEVFRAKVEGVGVPGSRYRCIYPGVDVDVYKPASDSDRADLREHLGIPADARVVISVGSLMPRKGFDRLLKAWALLKPIEGRDLLLIVGPSNRNEGLLPRFEQHAEALKRRADLPDLHGTVRFVGRNDQVQDWMATSDVLALLSRQEGFGIVSAEAMACGLPVVVSPLDGIAAEVLEHGESGYILEDPDDAAAVAEVLRDLLEAPAKGRRIGRKACARVTERFSMKSRARRLRDLYEHLGDPNR